MIPYIRHPKQTIPTSAVKIIGLGGAGANMLERIALDGMEGAELLALNTDQRTLSSGLALEKIQLGTNLTKGLGTGGDPDLGHRAVLESEEQIRASIKGRRIVFLCAGLGGGTGSGAAPIVTRIAREEGAFIVVFATMPFAFEGKRRREQAEASLNELAVLSNALVTFDNNRMGELVLAKQGVHEAFAAADDMVCESIKAVIRLVARPGLINVGLDDLMTALRANRSRCLFGSGIADGKDRAANALKNALNSPLLDQGTLLKKAQTVLVHLSGGEDLTLFEIELLMQRLQKFVPETAHVLFGAAVDPAMGNSLSITLISALPEDSLVIKSRESLSQHSQENPILDPDQEIAPELMADDVVAEEPIAEPLPAAPPQVGALRFEAAAEESVLESEMDLLIPEPVIDSPRKVEKTADVDAAVEESIHEPNEIAEPEPEVSTMPPSPKKKSAFASPWSKPKVEAPLEEPLFQEPTATPEPIASATPAEAEPPKLKLGVKPSGLQNELSLDSAPRGRFEGENPNVFEGEDLDLPPFLRKKK